MEHKTMESKEKTKVVENTLAPAGVGRWAARNAAVANPAATAGPRR